MNIEKRIIGLSGKKGTGKDQFCRFLQKRLGHGKNFAFATPIKEIAVQYMGLDREICFNAPNEVKNSTTTKWLWEEIPSNINSLVGFHSSTTVKPSTKNGKSGPMSYRDVLQWIGTDLYRRNMHEDFWVKCLLGEIKNDQSKWNIPDGCKSENCVNCGRNENTYIVTDIRFPNEAIAVQNEPSGIVVRIIREGAFSSDSHPSETSLDSWDGKIGPLLIPNENLSLLASFANPG